MFVDHRSGVKLCVSRWFAYTRDGHGQIALTVHAFGRRIPLSDTASTSCRRACRRQPHCFTAQSTRYATLGTRRALRGARIQQDVPHQARRSARPKIRSVSGTFASQFPAPSHFPSHPNTATRAAIASPRRGHLTLSPLSPFTLPARPPAGKVVNGQRLIRPDGHYTTLPN